MHNKKMLTAGLLVALTLAAFLSLGAVYAQEEETPRCDANWLAVAAGAIGVEEDALRAALDDGQTVAEVAEANDVDPETVVDALAAHIAACVDGLPSRMNRRFQNHAEMMALDLVYGDETGMMGFGRGSFAMPHMEAMPHGMFGFNLPDVLPFDDLELDIAPMVRGMMHTGWLEDAAGAIGVEVNDLMEALADGQTIAEVAEANDVDPQAVIDAIVAAETERLAENVADFVQGSLGLWGGRFAGRIFGDANLGRMRMEIAIGGAADWLDVAAETIGIERDVLVEALSEGDTVAEVAEANEVDPQAVIDAIVAAESEDLAARVADYVESEPGALGMGFGAMGEMMEDMPGMMGWMSCRNGDCDSWEMPWRGQGMPRWRNR